MTAPASPTPPPIPASEQIERFRADHARLRAQLAHVIVGQDAVIDHLLTCLMCGGHALLEGVPGIGKTLLIRTLAGSLSLSFGRIQFTPDLMPADITGTTVLHETDRDDGSRKREFRFQPGPIFAQIILADEINRATPKTQSALLEAMQERSVTASGTSHPLPRPFFVLATQNPLEQEGTYPLPEAQLDRFFFKILVPVPSRADLHEILARTTGADEPRVEPVLDAEALQRHQALVRRAAMAEHVRDFAVRAVLATHPESEFATPMVKQYVRVGASPRAAQAIVLASKALALLDGRAAASVDDIRRIAAPALRHRLILNFEGEGEGVTTDAVAENILLTLPVG